MDRITKFVAARLPESYDKIKQKKLTGMVHEMCSTISHEVGKLVTGIGRIDDDDEGTSRTEPVHAERSNRQSKRRHKQGAAVRDSLSSGEESFKSDSDGSEEDESESDESDVDRGNDESDSDSHSGDDVADDDVAENKEDKEDEEEEDEEEKEDDDDEESEDIDEDKGDDDGQGDEDDDDDNNGGGNISPSGEGGNNGGNEDAAAGKPDSDDEDECTLQYLIEKKDRKSKGLDEAVSISIRDVVMMEQESDCKFPWFPRFEVKEMMDFDEELIGVQARKIFDELLRGKEMELGMTFNLEELCPKWIRRKIMREIGALNEMGEAKKVGIPPLPPPKKKKSVSFILEPMVVTETAEELRAMHDQNAEQVQEGKETKSAMKKSRHFQLQQQAIPLTKEASYGTDKTQLETNTASSTAAGLDALPRGKDAKDAVSPGAVSKQDGNSYPKCKASNSHIMATQSKEEASSSVFEASIA